MYKIAAFITFNKKIEQKILSQKNKVKKIWTSNVPRPPCSSYAIYNYN